MPRFHRGHFILLARLIGENQNIDLFTDALIDALEDDNHRFDEARFRAEIERNTPEGYSFPE